MKEFGWIDWTVMLGTLFFIVAYGVWKSRGSKNIEGYLLGGKESNWWTIGLSVFGCPNPTAWAWKAWALFSFTLACPWQ